MEKNNFLLTDEKTINEIDYLDRNNLFSFFSKQPIEFFSKMRHFQPQIGCLNACRICSKIASTSTEYWTESTIRNIVSALKLASKAYRNNKPYIVWDRNEHRSGVIFSYLDNDIGNYYYLYEFIMLCYKELGVTTRISTVGYSRYNERLNEMHKKINENLIDSLGGVRLSFTPYEYGWCCNNNSKYNRYEYMMDMANFLSIYKPYYNFVGSGSREFCVELRYKPLVGISDVLIFNYKKRLVIYSNGYLYYSIKNDVYFRQSHIKNAFNHLIELTESPNLFYETYIINHDSICCKNDVKLFIDKTDFTTKKIVECYKMNNYDGEYYAFDPKIGIEGNFGINIFPKTKKRTKSGYIITERFLLNAIYKLKKEMNIGNLEPIENATWYDVNKVINYCISEIQFYNNEKNYEKSLYIKNEVIDFINVYIDALKEANYPAKVFFDPNFTIDTGIICNLGRAISEFKGLTSKFNEPLTPTHERNYGKYNSKMTKEGIAWRLSCGYENKVIIEELSLKDTARKRGQVQKEETIFLKNKNEKLNFDDLEIKQLIPGQVNKDTLYFYKEFGENGYLASYSDYGFNYDGIYWKTLEHYYQAQKFLDKNIKIKIANCNSPKEASNIGRSREYPIIDDWDKKRVDIMRKGLLLKFTNNAIIKNKLLLTGDKTIIEATTKELFWGSGLSGFGENNYGKLLMEVRSIIKKENL